MKKKSASKSQPPRKTTSRKAVTATPTRPRYLEEEKTVALETVIACNGNVSEAARVLNIAEDTLRSWTLGRNISDEAYKDYKENARARVCERLTTMHASKEEVLSLLALHLRGDIADLAECFTETGQLDLIAAKQQNVSRTIKKVKHRATPKPDGAGGVVYEFTTEVEIHDPQGAAQKLIGVYGMSKQPDDNPAKLERIELLKRAAERKRVQLVEQKGWTPEAADKLVREVYPEVSQLVQ